MMDFLIDNAKPGALVLFSTFFTAVLIWLVWPGNKEKFNAQARSILEGPDEQ